eukprot:scaffold145067_cov37-Tisochrysis_lutea.AAC.2
MFGPTCTAGSTTIRPSALAYHTTSANTPCALWVCSYALARSRKYAGALARNKHGSVRCSLAARSSCRGKICIGADKRRAPVFCCVPRCSAAY